MKNSTYILIALFLISCGGDTQNSSSSITQKKISANLDNATTAKEGGYGFEKIADDLGYKTYEWNEEKDGTFFGDPKAIKGGTLNYIHSLFPRTMRVIGQNSSQVLNSRTISALCYEGLLSQHPTTLEFIPKLASHWKISDDKMTFEFRINPDARWWDGMPVTSDDVIATWDLRMDETILSPAEQITYGKFERPIAKSKYCLLYTSDAADEL